MYGSACCGETPVSNSVNSLLDEWFKSYVDVLKDTYKLKDIVAIPYQLYRHYATILLNGLNKGFKDRIGNNIAYDSPDHKRILMLRANIHRFSSASTWVIAKKLNKLVKNTKDWTEFKHKAINEGKTVLAHLHTEYLHAHSVGQNASSWLRASENTDVVDLMYQTIGDKRIRPEHAKWDGIVAPVGDKIWDKLYTPNGWRDRCEIIEIPKGSRKLSDTSKVTYEGIGKGFDYNVGKEKENFYYKDFFGHSYKLRKEKLFEKFKHKRYKEENRQGIAVHVEEILNNPDEVWMKITGNEKNKKRANYDLFYHKKYKNSRLVVLTNTESSENMEVITWFEADEKRLGNSSSGIPIYLKE